MSVLKYRADIDGLRAIAVVAVLLFHFDKRLLPGGFIGVDVFFVVSGYLIASIIISECENGKFSFLCFYQRRIARIFPVFFLVILITLVTASFVYTPLDFAFAGNSAIVAALSVANLKFILEGNYFQMSLDARPLLHMWSLSVEEQFYIIFPLIIYLAFRLGVSRRKLLYFLVAMFVISFTACIALTTKNPTWAFYLLPTRAWELLAGCILAAYQRPAQKTENQRLVSILSNIGLLMIVASFFVIQEKMSFPGFIAAVPVAGTVLLIAYSQTNQMTSQQSIAARLLSYPLVVFIGKMSYSLYLWHWPIYCFVDYFLYSHSSMLRTTLKIFLTSGFSLISYHWIEKPVRIYLNQPTRQFLSFVAFVSAITTFVIVGFLINTNNYFTANLNTISNGGIVFNSKITNPRIVLMGDSHASMYAGTLKEISQKIQIKVNVISAAGGHPWPGNKQYKDSLLFLNTNPDVTIFVGSWTGRIGENHDLFKTALTEILQKSKHVILITEPPVLPKYASREEIRKSGQHQIFEDPTTSDIRKNTNAFLLSQQNDRVHVLEIDPLFKKMDGEICFTDSQNRQIYQDAWHLSAYGGNVVEDLLLREISKILSLPPLVKN
jgi:peptidoglycan/LPS O-acetylase OafA/YrhL